MITNYILHQSKFLSRKRYIILAGALVVTFVSKYPWLFQWLIVEQLKQFTYIISSLKGTTRFWNLFLNLQISICPWSSFAVEFHALSPSNFALFCLMVLIMYFSHKSCRKLKIQCAFFNFVLCSLFIKYNHVIDLYSEYCRTNWWKTDFLFFFEISMTFFFGKWHQI